MTTRFDGMDGFALQREAAKGIKETEKPAFREALVSRVEHLKGAGPEGNAEVLAVKDTVDRVFPGEPIYFGLKG